MSKKRKPQLNLADLQQDVVNIRTELNGLPDDDRMGIMVLTEKYKAAKEKVRVFSFRQKQSVTPSGHAIRL